MHRSGRATTEIRRERVITTEVGIFIITADMPVVGQSVFQTASDEPTNVAFIGAAAFFIREPSTGEGDRLMEVEVGECYATRDVGHPLAEGPANARSNRSEVMR